MTRKRNECAYIFAEPTERRDTRAIYRVEDPRTNAYELRDNESARTQSTDANVKTRARVVLVAVFVR